MYCFLFSFSHKILATIFGSLKCVFPKCTFLGPKSIWVALVWYLLNSSKVLVSHGRPAGLIKYSIDRYLLDNPTTLNRLSLFHQLVSSNSRPFNPTDTYLTQDGIDKMQPEIQVGLTIIIKLLYPQSQPFWTTPLSDEDARQNMQAQDFLSRLKSGRIHKVARIHKKDMRLDRAYTKAKPQTRGWSLVLHRITDPLDWA